MSLSMSDAARFLALELRVAELEKQVSGAGLQKWCSHYRDLRCPSDCPQTASCEDAAKRREVAEQAHYQALMNDPNITVLCDPPKRRGRPPKNLEERMKAQEHDPIDSYAGMVARNNLPDAE